MRILLFFKFLIQEVCWTGIKFFLEIPSEIYKDFKKKYPK